MRRRDYLLGIP